MWFEKKKPNFVVVDCVNSCLKEKCPKWVVLYHNIKNEDGSTAQKSEGKCAIAWLPSLIIELKEALRK